MGRLIIQINADHGDVTNTKRVLEEIRGLYQITHLIGAKIHRHLPQLGTQTNAPKTNIRNLNAQIHRIK
jgi:hypothetical protein